jgi:hypothetical protein
MRIKSIGRGLILLAGAIWLGACGPKATGEPPPQSAGNLPTSSDAALPAVPLSGHGVIVPSDVPVEAQHKVLTSPSAPAPAPASPGGH